MLATWISLRLIPAVEADMCQYRACTGPMLTASASTGPVLAHTGMFWGLMASTAGRRPQ